MRILFNARAGYQKAWPYLYNSIRKIDSKVEATFITSIKEETDTVISIVPDSDIIQADLFVKEHWNEFETNKLNYFEEKYDCAPIWKYIYTDRFLINEDYDYCCKVTVGLFMFFEYVLLNRNVTLYYDEVIATLYSYIGYLVCRKNNINYVSQMIARSADSERHYIIWNDEYQNIALFDQNFQRKDYPEENKKWAYSILEKMRKSGIKPDYMIQNGRKPRFHLIFLGYPVLYCIRKYQLRYHNEYWYMNKNTYKATFNPMIFYFRYLLSKKFYQEPIKDDKFVLFPLHYQPEASTLVCAQKYEKQLYYIDSLAKSLPASVKLYVKEHYAFLGHRRLSFYKQLKQYPNVRLISPWADTRKLILESEFVATLTGTAGWEAVLLGKPVIVSGNIFFDHAPGVLKVEDVYLKYQECKETYKKPDIETLVQYLCEYYERTFPGCSNVLSEKYYTEENLSNLAKSLMEFIKNI